MMITSNVLEKIEQRFFRWIPLPLVSPSPKISSLKVTSQTCPSPGTQFPRAVGSLTEQGHLGLHNVPMKSGTCHRQLKCIPRRTNYIKYCRLYEYVYLLTPLSYRYFRSHRWSHLSGFMLSASVSSSEFGVRHRLQALGRHKALDRQAHLGVRLEPRWLRGSDGGTNITPGYHIQSDQTTSDSSTSTVKQCGWFSLSEPLRPNQCA